MSTSNLHLLNPMDEQDIVKSEFRDCIISDLMWADSAG